MNYRKIIEHITYSIIRSAMLDLNARLFSGNIVKFLYDSLLFYEKLLIYPKMSNRKIIENIIYSIFRSAMLDLNARLFTGNIVKFLYDSLRFYEKLLIYPK